MLCFARTLFLPCLCFASTAKSDEFIKERERYAEIGDDLDMAFVELIPGVPMAYNDRHPKPKTPPPKTPPKEPTPPVPTQAELDAAAAAAAAGIVEGAIVTTTTTIVNEDGTVTEVAVVAAVGVDGQPIPIVPEVPAEPPRKRTPPPFEYSIDLPPEGSEVPYVKNYAPPPPEPETPVVVEGEKPAEGEEPQKDETPKESGDGLPKGEVGGLPADGAEAPTVAIIGAPPVVSPEVAAAPAATEAVAEAPVADKPAEVLAEVPAEVPAEAPPATA